MPQFKALQVAYVFDKKFGCERHVPIGEIVESDLDLDLDVHTSPTGEAMSSTETAIFERLPDES